MTKTALILAAHGSNHDPEPCDLIRAYAADIAATHHFDEVTPAFHLGHPNFADALDALLAQHVTVVPIMTSEGYYSDVVLPRELARSRRRRDVRLHLTQPIGTHPGMIPLIETQAAILARRFFMNPAECALALIGHGTPKHPSSRLATESLAQSLAQRNRFARVEAFFLDEKPSVESILDTLSRRDLLIIPFLIAAGRHVRDDIPRRLGLLDPTRPTATPPSLPFKVRSADRRICCDAPIGANPAILDLILDCALNLTPASRGALTTVRLEAAT